MAYNNDFQRKMYSETEMFKMQFKYQRASFEPDESRIDQLCAATVIKKREILLAAEAKEGLSEEKDLSGVNREKCIREAGSVHNAILL